MMTTKSDIACEHCSSPGFIPILYGIKQPRRDTDLSLQGKLVLASGAEYGIGMPLWACERCFQPLTNDGYGIGESEVESTNHYERLNALFEGYEALSTTEREQLMGKAKLRDLLAELSGESGCEFYFVCVDDGAAVLRGNDDRNIILDCDRRTFELVSVYCRALDTEFDDRGQQWNLTEESTGSMRIKRVKH